MRVFKSMDIAGSSLTAHRTMMDIIAENLANVNTTRTPNGGPYQRKTPIFEEMLEETMVGEDLSARVVVKEIEVDDTPPRMEYDPGHPDANGDGYVAYPNVSVVREMADMMAASRAYEANLEIVQTARSMWEAATDLLK